MTTRERMGFGSDAPIGEQVETWSEDNDQALRSARTLFEADEFNIRLRTDLTDNEIRLIAKIKYYHSLVGLPELDDVVTELMMLKVSKNRKSREEFAKVVSSMKGQGGGMLGGLFNRGG